MEKINKQKITFGLLLIMLSVFFYSLHYAIFRDSHHIFLYLLGDIGFVFVEVLLVTLILHELLKVREKQTMLKKLNMVIGAFFSEVGTDLLKYFRQFDCDMNAMSEHLHIDNKWTGKDFKKV